TKYLAHRHSGTEDQSPCRVGMPPARARNAEARRRTTPSFDRPHAIHGTLQHAPRTGRRKYPSSSKLPAGSGIAVRCPGNVMGQGASRGLVRLTDFRTIKRNQNLIHPVEEDSLG